MRVVMWILDRCAGKVDAVETPIGFVPKAEDINIDGLDIDVDTVRELLDVDATLWKEEIAGIDEFYNQIGDRVPDELFDELASLKSRLG